MKTHTAFDSAMYRIYGSRHGSDGIHLQGQDTAALWQEYLPVFTEFGLDDAQRLAFLDLLARHTTARAARPKKLTERTLLVAERNAIIDDAWTWNKKAIGTLSALAREDAALSTALNNARAREDVDLVPSNDALAELLATHRDRISAAVPVQKRLDEVAGLRDRLLTIFGEVESAKGRPVADTEEIDELDGRLYIIMRDFNEIGRAAVRAGLIPDRAPHFRFNHLGATHFRQKAGAGPTAEDPAPKA